VLRMGGEWQVDNGPGLVGMKEAGSNWWCNVLSRRKPFRKKRSKWKRESPLPLTQCGVGKSENREVASAAKND